ncbi:MAG: hypothetical protein WC346_20890 [Methanogenium sp.]|jgi:hypothetical protein
MKKFIPAIKPPIDSILNHAFKNSTVAKLNPQFIKDLSIRLNSSITKAMLKIGKKRWLGLIAEFQIKKLEISNIKLTKQRDDLLTMLSKQINNKNKTCLLINEQFSWVLQVDNFKIPFMGFTCADYFEEHYKKLGYTVIREDKQIKD